MPRQAPAVRRHEFAAGLHISEPPRRATLVHSSNKGQDFRLEGQKGDHRDKQVFAAKRFAHFKTGIIKNSFQEVSRGNVIYVRVII